MKLLINRNDIEKYLQISIHRNEKDIERFVREVQLFDLKKKICEDFFLDLIDEKTATDYTELLEGGDYHAGNKRYYFAGLKTCLCYFFYARYVFKSHQKDTATGIVIKNNNDSSPVSISEKRDMQRLYEQDANDLWNEVVKYLDRNEEKYPAYAKCYEGCEKEEEKVRIKIRTF